MKDLSFIMPRTPFARAWSALGGLEIRIGKRVLKKEPLEHRLKNVSLAFDYAKSHIKEPHVEIEEKQDSEGRTIAFCVDWRMTEGSKTARRETEHVASYCQTLGLKLIRYETQPFYDVYPVFPDKGWALQEMLHGLTVENGVLYLGDSQTDNSAFKSSNISVGVIHDETPVDALDCDYLVTFEQVPDFLNMLVANDLLFSSDFPMLKVNKTKKHSSKRTAS
jgi:hypothetical protein